MIPNDVDITDIQFRVTWEGGEDFNFRKKHCFLEGFQASPVDPSGKGKKKVRIRKVANASVYISTVLDPPLNIKRSFKSGLIFLFPLDCISFYEISK